MGDTIVLKMTDNHVSCHIYTTTGKLYIIVNHQNNKYYFDDDIVGNIIYDTNLIKFTTEFFNNLNVACIDIYKLSNVTRGAIYLTYLTKPTECIFGFIDNIPTIC
jgi:hypothetical protein